MVVIHLFGIYLSGIMNNAVLVIPQRTLLSFDKILHYVTPFCKAICNWQTVHSTAIGKSAWPQRCQLQCASDLYSLSSSGRLNRSQRAKIIRYFTFPRNTSLTHHIMEIKYHYYLVISKYSLPHFQQVWKLLLPSGTGISSRLDLGCRRHKRSISLNFTAPEWSIA